MLPVVQRVEFGEVVVDRLVGAVAVELAAQQGPRRVLSRSFHKKQNQSGLCVRMIDRLNYLKRRLKRWVLPAEERFRVHSADHIRSYRRILRRLVKRHCSLGK
jgi:hypothetical protein